MKQFFKKTHDVIKNVIPYIVIIGLIFFAFNADLVDPLMAQGVTNFDSLTLGDNLIVTGTTTLTGTSTFTGAVTQTGATGHTGAVTFASLADLNGVADALVLDTDGDTTISADTDDTINIEISAADDFVLTANTFTVSAGSMINPENATLSGAVFAALNTVAFGDTANKTMFVIPANADIVDVIFNVTTLFNSSGTDVVACGTTTGDPDEYVDDLDVETAGMNRMGDAADMALTDAPGDVGASDITVLCKFTQSVADANAGSAQLIITFRID